MASKFKITFISLSAAFALAVTPLAAIIVESGFNLEKITDDTHQKFKARKKEIDVELEFEVSTALEKSNSCLEKETLPLLAMAETFGNWSKRLSFSAPLATPLKKAKNDLEIQGFLKGMECIAR